MGPTPGLGSVGKLRALSPLAAFQRCNTLISSIEARRGAQGIIQPKLQGLRTSEHTVEKGPWSAFEDSLLSVYTFVLSA